VAILFDPKFLRQVPHAVAAASERCQSWKQDGYYHYCGNLTVVVVNEYLEAVRTPTAIFIRANH
jgi:hypothetical protein